MKNWSAIMMTPEYEQIFIPGKKRGQWELNLIMIMTALQSAVLNELQCEKKFLFQDCRIALASQGCWKFMENTCQLWVSNKFTTFIQYELLNSKIFFNLISKAPC